MFHWISKAICVPMLAFFIKKVSWGIRGKVRLEKESFRGLTIIVSMGGWIRLLLGIWERLNLRRWVVEDRRGFVKIIWILNRWRGCRLVMMEEGLGRNRARWQTMRLFWRMDKVCSLRRRRITIETGCAVRLILLPRWGKICQGIRFKFYRQLLRVRSLFSQMQELKLLVKKEEEIIKTKVFLIPIQILNLMISFFLKTVQKAFFGIDNPSNKNYLVLNLIY